MKKNTPAIISVLVAIMVLASIPFNVFAAEVPTPALDSDVINEDLTIGDLTEDELGNSEETRADGHYYWKVTSKKVASYPYGGWRKGPSGKGPAKISLTNSQGYNYSVTNTISGSYTSVATIESALNVTIGKAKTYSASYSVNVPKGNRYQIIYRPQFKRYKVVQTQYYRIDGYSTKTGKTKTCYVKIFSNWDYSWNKI
ncbi:MAG TPA: hypothetical protein GX736_05900 [Mogibacterium sp.]|nr:hypothetical protein [Mogibacterium sp.]